MLHLLTVNLGQVGAVLGNFLKAGNFLLLFALEVFFSLALDELTFEHFFLDFLDVGELEILKLVTDFTGVVLFNFVFFLELSPHLLVVLPHLLNLNFLPVALDFFLLGFLALSKLSLSVLLVEDVGQKHLGLECLDHVLLFMHVVVSLLDLLPSQLVLVTLLLGVYASALDLKIKVAFELTRYLPPHPPVA